MSDRALPWAESEVVGEHMLTRARDARSSAEPREAVPVVRLLELALAYYIGATIGFLFQAPGAPQSVLWLPNSILLAALLMVPVWQWPWYLVAAFPAQMLIAMRSGSPLGAMSLLYLTNCADAALGAMAVRFITRGQWRLDSLRNLIVLFACATAGVALVSFLDAGITSLTGWSTAFWPAYVTRLRANTLTNVILVPAIIGTLSADVSEWRHAPLQRMGEALLILTAILVVSALAFSRPIQQGGAAWLYIPIPLLLLAAVRFGPGTVGWSLLVVAIASSWTALRGVGVFTGGTPDRNIMSVQFFLLSISVPLMCLTVLVKEREGMTRELVTSRNAIRISIDTVRDLAGRLIAAQEEERMRIARELHDAVSQHIADMAITLSSMRRTPAVRAAGMDEDFLRLYDQTSGLFESVRSLSHELHPSVLRHAGLVPAIDALCTSFNKQHGVPVTFLQQEVEPLSEPVSLTAYRVVQEALRNISDHAEAKHVEVVISRAPDHLLLSVRDNGTGFDTETARQHGNGLGLVSMEERVRLVQGHLRIHSGAAGTSIDVSIPLNAMPA